ncbi:hypothetical protein VNO78_28059 [Psophocarpus tetragonolobus]|uniref:Uncharacterized protein n=1 Tax=Psophocarpus tetragonolobus TaxID=3891 RepID=A0AAN9S132_PSOTE
MEKSVTGEGWWHMPAVTSLQINGPHFQLGRDPLYMAKTLLLFFSLCHFLSPLSSRTPSLCIGSKPKILTWVSIESDRPQKKAFSSTPHFILSFHGDLGERATVAAG